MPHEKLSEKNGNHHRTTQGAPNQTEIEVEGSHDLLALTGPGASHLRKLEQEFGIHAGLRGHTIRLQGGKQNIELAEKLLRELLISIRQGRVLDDEEIASSIRLLKREPEANLRAVFDDVVLVASDRKTIGPKGPAQQMYVQAIREHDLVFGIGPAGTGKTYLAMAMAVRWLQEKRVKRIILTRPAVEAGEKLGFLPGDLAEKVNPYLRPLYDAMYDMMESERVQMWIAKGIIEVAPLAFMRGRTLNDSFVVLDEAQNTSMEQMKMFLTRLGFGSKAVVTGDITQVDLPVGKQSGLYDAAQVLKNVSGIQFVYFTDADVVRHPLVQRIVRAYGTREREATP